MMNLVTRFRQCWQPVRLYLGFIMPARFAMITLGIVAFAFIANGQGQDILRALAEADADGSVHWPRTLLFVAAVALLASVVWFSTLHLLTSQRNDFPRTAKLLPRFLARMSDHRLSREDIPRTAHSAARTRSYVRNENG